MAATREDLPEDIDALRAALLAECARAARVETELAVARAKVSDDAAVIAPQRLQIEKLTRQLYGLRSERTVRLLDQMELAFEELESSASEDAIAAERAVAKTHFVARMGGVDALIPPAPGSHNADVLRAPQVQHAVQNACRKRYLARLSSIC